MIQDCRICRQAASPNPECEECAALPPDRKAAAYAIARLPEYYDNRSPGWQATGLIDRLRKMGFELTPNGEQAKLRQALREIADLPSVQMDEGAVIAREALGDA